MNQTDLYASALAVNVEYKEAAVALRNALRGVASAAESLAETEGQIAKVEAQAAFDAVGSNETQRKAAAACALAENESYQSLQKMLRRERTTVSLLRAEVEYQTVECQRLRSFLSLLSNAVVAVGPG